MTAPAAGDPTLTIGEHADRLAVTASKILLAIGLSIRLFGDPSTGDRILASGLIALMATPAFRLLTTIVADIQRRDWLALAATLAVVAVLAWALAAAFG